MIKRFKTFKSPAYNFVFDRWTGFFARWGETKADDPDMSVFGPEILDIEISEGGCAGKCPWCYKSNPVLDETHMSLGTYRTILDKMPETLTQVAFGITDLTANPDFFPMMGYTRSKGIVPNFTTTGIGMDTVMAHDIAKVAGAVAVSVYPHTVDTAYDAIKLLTDAGMEQVNIHLLYHDDNWDFVQSVIMDRMTDPRLAEMHAIVLLGLKEKGLATDKFHKLSDDKFAALYRLMSELGIPFGFDSCSATKVLDLLPEDSPMVMLAEPCEAALFSSYIDVRGDFFPCSFMESKQGWETGLSVIDVDDFVEDVWFDPRVVAWRKRLMSTNRSCPEYTV